MTNTPHGVFPALSHDERKHWSKAMAASLRYGPGTSTIPPRTMPIQKLVTTLRTSRRFGQISEAKVHATLQGNHRFQIITIQDPVTSWWDLCVQAV